MKLAERLLSVVEADSKAAQIRAAKAKIYDLEDRIEMRKEQLDMDLDPDEKEGIKKHLANRMAELKAAQEHLKELMKRKPAEKK